MLAYGASLPFLHLARGMEHFDTGGYGEYWYVWLGLGVFFLLQPEYLRYLMKLQPGPVLSGILICGCCVLISIRTSDDRQLALMIGLRNFILSSFLVAAPIAFMCRTDLNPLRFLMYGGALSSPLVVAANLAHGQTDFLQMDVLDYNFGMHKIVLVQIYVFAFLCTSFVWLNTKSLVVGCPCLLLMGGYVSLTLLSRGRAAFIQIILLVAGILLFSARAGLLWGCLRRLFVQVMLLAMLFMAWITCNPNSKISNDPYVELTILAVKNIDFYEFLLTNRDATLADASSGHVTLARIGIETLGYFIREHPLRIIFGTGPGTAPAEMGDYIRFAKLDYFKNRKEDHMNPHDAQIHAHNLYLEWALELGLAGLLGLSCILYGFWRDLVLTWKRVAAAKRSSSLECPMLLKIVLHAMILSFFCASLSQRIVGTYATYFIILIVAFLHLNPSFSGSEDAPLA